MTSTFGSPALEGAFRRRKQQAPSASAKEIWYLFVHSLRINLDRMVRQLYINPLSGRDGEMETKKPYEKPAVVYREKIEAKAGSCAKVGAPGCSTGPYVS